MSLSRAGFVALCFLFCSAASADVYNPGIFPIGEREAFLGNTGVGRAWDTGAVYYNPAGLTEVGNSKISLSGSTYMNFKIHADDVIFLDNTANPYDASGFTSIPMDFVSSTTFGDWHAAFSVLVPNQLQVENLQSYTTPNSITDVLQFQRENDLWIGVTLARKLDPNWSVGVSLFGIQHSEASLISFRVALPAAPNSIIDSTTRKELSAFGFALVAGVSYQPDPMWGFGLRLRTPMLKISASADTYSATDLDDNGTLHSSRDSQSGVAGSYELPFDLTLGAVFEPASVFRLYWDVGLQLPVDYTSIPSSTLTTNIQTKVSFRTSLGVELEPVSRFPFRFGFLYSPSSVSQSRRDAGDVSENYLGFTGGIGFKSDHLDTGLGAFYVWGSGQVRAATLNADPNAPTGDVTSKAYGAILTTAYIF